jgi:hypothetical protein
MVKLTLQLGPKLIQCLVLVYLSLVKSLKISNFVDLS